MSLLPALTLSILTFGAPPSDAPESAPASAPASAVEEEPAQGADPDEEATSEAEEDVAPSSAAPSTTPAAGPPVATSAQPSGASSPAKPAKDGKASRDDARARRQADASERRSAPRQLRRRGIGMFVGAGVSAVFGMAMTGARTAVIQTGECRDPEAQDEYSSQTRACIAASVVYIGGTWGQTLANTVAFGLSAGGGVFAGRHDAYFDHRAGRERRTTVGLIAGGASLMSISVIAGLALQISLWTGPNESTVCNGRLGGVGAEFETIPLAGCWDKKWKAHVVGTEITQLGAGAGVGMLTYGATHRRHSRLHREGRRVHLRWSPITTPRMTGISLSGQF